MHMHKMPKEKIRVAWILLATAGVAMAATFGYLVISSVTAPRPTAATESAIMVGSWSGTYTTDGVTFGVKMRISDLGGCRLKAAMKFTENSAITGYVSDSETMTGKCSGSSVNMANDDGDLRGTPPADSDGAFTGTMDFGISLTFSLTKN
jgi:hypothetical protein